MATTTTAIFSVHRGSGRVTINNTDVTYGQAITINNNDNVKITRTRGNFSVNIQNTGANQLSLSGALIPAGGIYGGYAYRNGNFTATVGTGGPSFDFIIPEARWEDLVTNDVIENARFFTYSGSTLVNSNIRSPKIFALDTSVALFRFIIIYYDLTSNQLKGLPYSYNSSTGVFTYGSVVVLGSTGNLTNCTQLTFQPYCFFLDAILTDSTHFLVNYYVEGVAGAVILRSALFSFSGIAITVIGSELTLTSSLYVTNEDGVRPRQVEYPELKTLTSGRTLCIYQNFAGLTRSAVLINTSGDTYSLSAVVNITNGFNASLMGFEVIDSTHFVVQGFGTDGVTDGFYSNTWTVSAYAPFAATSSATNLISAYDGVSDPGYGQVIKLSNGNYVFLTAIAQGAAANLLTLATYSVPNFSFPSQINITNYITMKTSTGNLFITYRFFETDEILTRYDTTAGNLSSATTLSLTFSNMTPVNILAFGTRFITCNIYNSTTYATISGTITPLARLTDYKAVSLQVDSDPVVPIVGGNTMTVGLLPNTTYYSHTETGALNDIGFSIPTYIDDRASEIGSTDATGTILTFS